jgi:hypothetical protein
LALDGSIGRYRKASDLERLERKWFPLAHRYVSGKTGLLAWVICSDLKDAATTITLTFGLER